MKKLLKYLNDYKKECVLAPLFKMLEACFELFVPLVVASIVDVGIARGDKGYIVSRAGIMVALGLIGIPIFAAGGGFGYIFNPTFGFLLGLIPAAWVVGRVCGDSLAPRRMALASLAGLAVLYAVGMPYMALILNVYMGKGMTFSAILWAGMLPYLPGDAVKIVIAAGVCPILRRRLKLADTSHKRGE